MTGAYDLQLGTAQGAGWDVPNTPGASLIHRVPYGVGYRQCLFTKRWGGTTLNQLGYSVAPTENGTKSEVSDTDGNWIDYSASPGGSLGGIQDGTGGSHHAGRKLAYHACIKTGPSLVNTRWCLGFATSFPASGGTSDSPTGSPFVGFRYFQDGSDSGHWWAWVNDGDAGTSHSIKADTGVSIVADTMYNLSFFWDAGTSWYFINGIYVASLTDGANAEHPTAGNPIDVYCEIYNVDGVNGRSIKLSHVWAGMGMEIR